MAEEAKLQSRIIKFLEKKWYTVLKLIKTNKNGIPDLQVLTWNGKHFWIEVKSSTWKLSELQKYRIEELTKKWDHAMVVYSYEQFEFFYEEIIWLIK